MIYCVDDEKLKEMFSEFGNVTSSKVIAKKMHANIFFLLMLRLCLNTSPLIICERLWLIHKE